MSFYHALGLLSFFSKNKETDSHLKEPVSLNYKFKGLKPAGDHNLAFGIKFNPVFAMGFEIAKE